MFMAVHHVCRVGYRQRRGGAFKEDPYVFLDGDSDVMKSAG